VYDCCKRVFRIYKKNSLKVGFFEIIEKTGDHSLEVMISGIIRLQSTFKKYKFSLAMGKKNIIFLALLTRKC
jgi:hypothetical protein